MARTPLERFTAKIAPGLNGCIVWTGASNEHGYGFFYDGDRVTYAHRWSYEHHVAPIPAGLHIDHLCRNRICVNHAHLEPVTPGENTRRGEAIERASAFQRAKTACPKGHPYSGENTYIHPQRDTRDCRACRTEAGRRHRLRQKTTTAGLPTTERVVEMEMTL